MEEKLDYGIFVILGSQDISHNFMNFNLTRGGNVAARRHPFFPQPLTSRPCPHKLLHSHTLNL